MGQGEKYRFIFYIIELQGELKIEKDIGPLVCIKHSNGVLAIFKMRTWFHFWKYNLFISRVFCLNPGPCAC